MITTILLQATANYQSLIMMGGIMLVFYFFMIRPQMNKAKEHKKYVEQLKKGEKIVTTAGIHGKVVDVNETTFLLEVDGGGKIRFDKSAVSVEATKAATKA